MKQTWEFNNTMDCALCKYDCNKPEPCPYTAGWADGQKKLLEYLRDHEWYTKIIPQGKGQRIISKRTGISQEFVASLLKELETK